MRKNKNEISKKYQFEKIASLVSDLYGLEVKNITPSELGAGSQTYFVECVNGKYVVKFPAESTINNPLSEIEICEFLLKSGFPACEFIENKFAKKISEDENGKKFHIQKFIEGRTFDHNSAPAWLMKESATMLGKIHCILKNYHDLPRGIGENFLNYRTIQGTLESYNNSLVLARQCGETQAEEGILTNIEILKNFTDYQLNMSEFTYMNTHGDYMVSQLICGDDRINAVIDWTTTCSHPAVWEIIRSYCFASPLAKYGKINTDDFLSYLSEYEKYNILTQYDVENIGKLYFKFLAVCDFYGQYLTSSAKNREIYLEQAMLSTSLLKWFEKNCDAFTQKLKEYYLSTH